MERVLEGRYGEQEKMRERERGGGGINRNTKRNREIRGWNSEQNLRIDVLM